MRLALLSYNISKHEPLAAFWWLSICRTVHIPNARLCRSRVCQGVSRCVEGVKVSRLDTLTIPHISSCQCSVSVSRLVCQGVEVSCQELCRGVEAGALGQRPYCYSRLRLAAARGRCSASVPAPGDNSTSVTCATVSPGGDRRCSR